MCMRKHALGVCFPRQIKHSEIASEPTLTQSSTTVIIVICMSSHVSLKFVQVTKKFSK